MKPEYIRYLDLVRKLEPSPLPPTTPILKIDKNGLFQELSFGRTLLIYFCWFEPLNDSTEKKKSVWAFSETKKAS